MSMYLELNYLNFIKEKHYLFKTNNTEVKNK